MEVVAEIYWNNIKLLGYKYKHVFQVSEGDTLPSMVCPSCVRIVEFWQGFRDDCRHTQVFLQESIGLMSQNHPTYTELHQVLYAPNYIYL